MIQSPLIDKFFKIIHKNNSCEHTNHTTLNDTIVQLYNILFGSNEINLIDIQIVCYYMGIPVINFNLGNDNGLILYNDDNYIRICALFPEYNVIDTAYTKFITSRIRKYPSISDNTNKFQRAAPIDNNNNNIKTYKYTAPINNIKTSKHTVPVNNNKKYMFDRKNTDRNCNTRNSINSKKNVKNGSKLEDINNLSTDDNINYDFSEQIKIFESDKRSYFLIKKDLDDDVLKRDQIHPDFVLKYLIFKVLELREAINFASNSNIDNEFEIFSNLYEEYQKDNEVDEPPHKVYIPHNYNYMTPDEKDKYAHKYNMTRQQFENKYINIIVEDDDIFGKINDKNIEEINDDTDNKSDTDDKSDTGKPDDNPKPKIDPGFLELIKEYNNS